MTGVGFIAVLVLSGLLVLGAVVAAFSDPTD
jgi:hypothetical protein